MIGNPSRIILALISLVGIVCLFVPSWVSYRKDYESLEEGVLVQCRTVVSNTRCELVNDWPMYVAAILIVTGISIAASLAANPTLHPNFIAAAAVCLTAALTMVAFLLYKPIDSFDGRVGYGLYMYTLSVAAISVVLGTVAVD